MLPDINTSQIVTGRYGRVRCEPGWSLAPRWSKELPDYDLWWIWAGEGTIRLRDRELALRPGLCFWMRPGGLYLAEQSLKNRLGVSFLHFHLESGGKPLPFIDRGLPEVYHPEDPIAFNTLFNRAIHLLELPDGSPAGVDLSQGVVRCLLFELTFSHKNEPITENNPHAKPIREQLIRWREQPGNIPPVSDLAKEVGLGVDHYTRCFSKLTGMTPREWRIKTRIERACALLAETSLNVSQLSDMLGYGDIYHFSKQFKAQLGCSPKQYRQRLSNT